MGTSGENIFPKNMFSRVTVNMIYAKTDSTVKNREYAFTKTFESVFDRDTFFNSCLLAASVCRGEFTQPSLRFFPVCTVLVLRMAHRKWKETKQQPIMLSGPAVPGCCLVYLHILWAILSTSTVQWWRMSIIKSLRDRFKVPPTFEK